MNGVFDRITQAFADEEPQVTPDVEAAGENELPDQHQESERTPARLREVSQDLLRFGLLEERQKPNFYKVAVRELDELNRILEPLDLFAAVDDVRGLVFLKVLKADENADVEEEWSHPLVRKQRLNLEQSLLLAILRQYFVAHEQEAGTGATQALVAVDELIPQMQVYLGDQGSESQERSRILELLNQLKEHGVVTAPDKDERVMIRPVIAHLANPENLTALLHWLRERAQNECDTHKEREQ
ncbi:hypothetical protein GU3_07310 [Oceanimonas sp. GK1]|uniref:DUF4194 domain-containing protein n=1 Tax=Oceanimonas sp. (strain GK1 / IBRC-M 10197) TaxID=511062 RepID=UPI0002494EB5|nr:DUF4194 domain-containing protein [Oceanimonas sp. GK1]AEY01218.1 hypothetical protein GU3_07310 [Oceanimonas sp. GK1]